MNRKAIWTQGQDTQIRRLRTEGATWDVIAAVLGLARCTIIERARILGVEQPPANAATVLDESERAPLPAGHPDTWGAINRGTVLGNTRFRAPGTLR
jgi:hypothetical protein